jgi:hypothetical protein
MAFFLILILSVNIIYSISINLSKYKFFIARNIMFSVYSNSFVMEYTGFDTSTQYKHEK